jgi:hypothetical protein
MALNRLAGCGVADDKVLAAVGTKAAHNAMKPIAFVSFAAQTTQSFVFSTWTDPRFQMRHS